MIPNGAAPRLRSTRAEDPSDGPRVLEGILEGLAPDGGLYVPDRVPPLPDGWRDATSLGDLAARILPGWIDELPADEVVSIARDALDFDTPVVALSDARFVLELFHGPTLSFKDVGARTMARLMNAALERRDGRALILVATSGDTGSAVADGFAGMERIEVVLLYPKGRVSEVQERQLTTARPNVRAFAVEGAFDDCQRMVKDAFGDPALAELPLSSANSINIGRLLPQALYYVWAALQLERAHGVAPAQLRVCVPSGNLGNLTGGVLADRMGLGFGAFLAAHNANDFFPAYLAGRRAAFDFPATRATYSNAMDVGAPSNFERLHALLGDELAQRIWGTSVDDAATLAAMRRAWREDGYLACPHTAVGLEGVRRFREASGDRGPALVLATAHPAKFPSVVAEALPEVDPPKAPELEALRDRATRVRELAPTLDALRDALLG